MGIFSKKKHRGITKRSHKKIRRHDQVRESPTDMIKNPYLSNMIARLAALYLQGKNITVEPMALELVKIYGTETFGKKYLVDLFGFDKDVTAAIKSSAIGSSVDFAYYKFLKGQKPMMSDIAIDNITQAGLNLGIQKIV